MSLSKEQNSTEMEAAFKAFKDWRSTREKMCRIPDRLWEIAAKLSPQYPINTICENLGLNWGALKKKIDHLSLSADANHPVKPQKQPSFVELKLNGQEQTPSLFLNHSTSPYSPRCAIELTKPDGEETFSINITPAQLHLLIWNGNLMQAHTEPEWRKIIPTFLAEGLRSKIIYSIILV